MMGRNTMGASAAGFTLIEVVVALAIMALSLGVLYESFGWSLRRTATLERRQEAWLTAQSLLAELRAQRTLSIGTADGEAQGGLRWTSRISARPAAIDPANSLQPFDVTIEVSWGTRAAQKIRLQSVEVGRVPS